jgi:hypothetical protein
MTQQKWETASEEERNAEYKKCIDEPWYLYNTYWRRPTDREWSKEDWEAMQGFVVTRSRRITRFDPVTYYQKMVASYEGRPTRSRGHHIKWENDPEEAYPIPITLALTDPEKYAELVAKKKEIYEKMWGQIKDTLKLHNIEKVQLVSTVAEYDKNWLEEIWKANTTPNYKKAFNFKTEEDAKYAYDKMATLSKYFIPAYGKFTDEWGNKKEDE